MRQRTRSAYRVAWGIALVAAVFGIGVAQAAAPSGNDWFQILANPSTGGDNTGDGGTGLTQDFNYYYVGQSFTGTMQINVDTPSGSNASNIWVDYSTTTHSITNLTTGTFFSSWSGQVVSSTIGRAYSTGFRTSGYSTGQGSFGTMDLTMVKPSEAAYGTGSPAQLTINTGTIGATTESNISHDGTDLLDSVENFQFHVWADTKKPYAKNPSPANAAAAVAIDVNYAFDLRDSKNGSLDDSGVGTGVNTAEPPGSITTDDGGGPASVTAYDAFSCSGIWGTNLCNTTVDPLPPSGIAGDTRNWKYATTYTVTISGFKDFASPAQNQLGDANGPNTMDPISFTFTTEADTVAPRVTAETPVRASGGNSPSTNLVIDVEDRKTYPGGPSGVGLALATCSFNVSSPSVPLTTYTSVSAGVVVSSIPYGSRFTINPAVDFAENETVSVSAFNCQDLVGNTMVTDNWTFTTADSAAPYVTGESPSNDQTSTLDQNVTFHIKDDGSGVSLANTTIFVNGVYYTNAGGAGSVTTNGTKITFASSLNFNGANYVGDTTSRTGTVNDEAFTINPQADFTAGEAIPVIIYTRDLSGNLMERVVYAFVATGTSSSCPAGSSFCGSNTSFNGSQCVGSGSSGGACSSSPSGTGGGGGIPVTMIQVNEPSVTIQQIDEHSVLVTWTTNLPGTSMVVYDVSSSPTGDPPRYSYRYKTDEINASSTYHAVTVSGLAPEQLYFLRPVSQGNGHYGGGVERIAVARYHVEVVTETQIKNVPGPVTGGTLVCPNPQVIYRPTGPVSPRPSVPAPAPAGAPAVRSAPAIVPTTTAPPPQVNVVPSRRTPKLQGVRRDGKRVILTGESEPNASLTVTIY